MDFVVYGQQNREETARESFHRHSALQINQQGVCRVCHPRLSKADGRGHVQNQGGNARKLAKGPT